MKTLLPMILLLTVAVTAAATEIEDRLDQAEAAYRAGKFDAALMLLEPLIDSKQPMPVAPRVKILVAQVLHSRGEDHFRHGRIAECVADFDRQVELQPGSAAEHWQRGIAYYYAEEFEKGARQFALHRTVNPEDVENAAWHFVCIARGPQGTIEVARQKLMDVDHDSRVPMAQVQQMFAGTTTPQEVLHFGESKGGMATFYAHLYVGLYFEAMGHTDKSLRMMQKAAENPDAKKSYMGDVARVHVALRKKKSAHAQHVDAKHSR